MTATEAAPRPWWLGPALWTALLRHAIPVVGVLFLGWLPLDFLLFLLVETWLFLTLRTGIEVDLESAASGRSADDDRQGRSAWSD